MMREAQISPRNRKYSDVEEATNEEEELGYRYDKIPPDGGYGWFVTATCLLCLVISDGILFSFGLTLSDMKKSLGEPVPTVAGIFSIVNGISLFSGLTASALSHHFGFRVVVITGSIIGASGLILISFFITQSTYSLFIMLSLLLGIVDGIISPRIVIVARSYFCKRKGLATGIALCGSGAGAYIFAPLVFLLLETHSNREIYFILAGIYLNCATLGWFLVPLNPRRRRKLQEGTKLIVDDVASPIIVTSSTLNDVKGIPHVQGQLDDEAVEFAQQKQQCTSNRKSTQKRCAHFLEINKFWLFRSPTFVVICFSSFFQKIGWSVSTAYLTDYAIQNGISRGNAPYLLLATGIASILVCILSGYFSDRPKVSVLLVNNIGLSIAAVLLNLCPLGLYHSSYGFLLIFLIVFRLIASCITVTRPILLEELVGSENFDKGYVYVRMFNKLAKFVGMGIVGIYGIGNVPDVAFYVGGSSVLLSACLCYPLGWINRREKRRNSKSNELATSFTLEPQNNSEDAEMLHPFPRSSEKPFKRTLSH